LDVLRRAEDTFEPGTAGAWHHDGEVARACVSEPFAVEQDRGSGGEERLADDELALLRDLGDDAVDG